MSALLVTDVSKSFGTAEVLRGVSLEVAAGTTTAVVGSSGCGKTTLLRVIAGFESPDTGSVSIAGERVAAQGFSVPSHRRNVGYVAQDGALFPHLTVAQNIAYGLGGWLGKGRRRAAAARVVELLDMVALDATYAKRRPHELSGGQQQRVALARALAREPDLMLLDEPFSALDAGLRAATRKAVAGTLREAGVTTILVTHDQEEALSFAGQVAVMRAGAFTQVGAPQTVYAAPVDLFTAAFMGDCVLLDAKINGDSADCVLGRIPVSGSPTDGGATIMLRPEQLVAKAVSNIIDATHVGTVTGAEFLGSDVVLDIELGSESVAVRQASVIAPGLGEKVSIEVLGAAVAYAAASTR